MTNLETARDRAKDELIELYANELSDNATFLFVHGIKTSDEKVEKGKQLRERIASLTKQIEKEEKPDKWMTAEEIIKKLGFWDSNTNNGMMIKAMEEYAAQSTEQINESKETKTE